MRARRPFVYIPVELKSSDKATGGTAMPRYLVERSFPEGLKLTADDEGAEMCRTVVMNNAEENVTWIHS